MRFLNKQYNSLSSIQAKEISRFLKTVNAVAQKWPCQLHYFFQWKILWLNDNGVLKKRRVYARRLKDIPEEKKFALQTQNPCSEMLRAIVVAEDKFLPNLLISLSKWAQITTATRFCEVRWTCQIKRYLKIKHEKFNNCQRRHREPELIRSGDKGAFEIHRCSWMASLNSWPEFAGQLWLKYDRDKG